MLKHQIICFGANHVPGITLRTAGGDEVGVYSCVSGGG
jgi:hypothetical protein